jgi:hypothetical protein
MMGNLAEGEIEFYQSVCCSFNMPCFSSFNVFFFRQWKSGSGLYLSFNVYGWTFSVQHLSDFNDLLFLLRVAVFSHVMQGLRSQCITT